MSNENEEVNLDRDWAVTVNLSGIAAPTGAKNVDVPKGYYKCLVSDMYINPDRNPNRVILKMTINEGEFTGQVRTDGMTKPKGAEDKVRYYWRGLAESAGYTPTQLDAGQVDLGRKSFVDKTVHIFFVPKTESSSGYEEISYLAPAEWTAQRQMFDANNRSESTDAVVSNSGANPGGASEILSKLKGGASQPLA